MDYEKANIHVLSGPMLATMSDHYIDLVKNMDPLEVATH